MTGVSDVFTASDYHRLPELDRRRFRAWCVQALTGTGIDAGQVSTVILVDKGRVTFDVLQPDLSFRVVTVRCKERPPMWVRQPGRPR